MVTGALKYPTHRHHAEKITDSERAFDAAASQRFIPKPVLQLLEKKRKANNTSRSTTVVSQVARALQQLTAFTAPLCILELETFAKPEDSRF
jgi:hypothetical protein